MGSNPIWDSEFFSESFSKLISCCCCFIFNIIIQIIKVLEFVFCLYFAVMDGWSLSDRDCQVCLNLSLTKDFLMADRFDL